MNSCYSTKVTQTEKDKIKHMVGRSILDYNTYSLQHIIYEKIQCPKCKGIGKYTVSGVFGIICDKCKGEKNINSQKAEASFNIIETINSYLYLCPMNRLRVGDRVMYTFRWFVVRKISSITPSSVLVHGVRQYTSRLTITMGNDEGETKTISSVDTNMWRKYKPYPESIKNYISSLPGITTFFKLIVYN